MHRRVVMEYGLATALANKMQCSLEMVSRALNYKKNSSLARKIRNVAINEYGGKVFNIE